MELVFELIARVPVAPFFIYLVIAYISIKSLIVSYRQNDSEIKSLKFWLWAIPFYPVFWAIATFFIWMILTEAIPKIFNLMLSLLDFVWSAMPV